MLSQLLTSFTLFPVVISKWIIGVAHPHSFLLWCQLLLYGVNGSGLNPVRPVCDCDLVRKWAQQYLNSLSFCTFTSGNCLIVNRHMVHFHRHPPEKQLEGPQQLKCNKAGVWLLCSHSCYHVVTTIIENEVIKSTQMRFPGRKPQWRFMGKLGSTRGQWGKGNSEILNLNCFSNTHLCGLVARKLWHKSLCTVTRWHRKIPTVLWTKHAWPKLKTCFCPMLK